MRSAARTRVEKLAAEGAGAVSANDRDLAQANYDAAIANVASLTAQMKQVAAAIDTAKANLA